MAYASGKFSFGLCDYCGQRYPYNVLRKNWRGFKVCPDDYEPKEPQLEPLKYRGDAIALLEPRPDRVEPVDVYVGQPGYTYFQSVGSANNTNNMQPYPGQTSVYGIGQVGAVVVTCSVTVLVSGVSASASVEAVTIIDNSELVFADGVFATGAVDDPSVSGTASITPSGVGGSGGIGTVS